jgi:hypothetical protein
MHRIGPLLLVVGVVALTVWTLLARQSPSQRPTAHGADTLDAQQAFLAGGRLGSAGRHAASIPYFQRAVAVGMGDTWEGRFNLAAAQINAALEVAPRFGRVDPALRSSYERVQSVFSGLTEARHAARLARDSRMRAYTAYQDALMLQFWGMPWDALAIAKVAASMDPGWEAPPRLVRELERDLARGGIPQ